MTFRYHFARGWLTGDLWPVTSSRDKMAKESEFDAKYYLAAIDKALKRADRFAEIRDHFARMYSGKEGPKSSVPSSWHVMNVNEVYGDTEVDRNSLGYRSPKFHVKSKHKKWYIINRPGNPRRQLVRNFDKEILRQMEEQGLNSHTQIEEGGQTVTYRILDGAKASKTAEAILNYLKDEKDVEAQVELVKADAKLGGVGALWVDYQGDFNIPCTENEYVKEDDIYVQYLSIADRDLIFDHQIEHMHNIEKAKWVGRRIRKTLAEAKDLLKYKTADGKPYFINKNLEELIDKGGSDKKTKRPMSDSKESSANYLQDEIDKRYMEDEREKGIDFYQLWIRPSYKEQMDPENPFRYGKIVTMADGYRNNLTTPRPWPHFMDGFPCEFLTYNLSLDDLYPPSDIKIYEELLLEKNNVRHYIRKFINFVSRIKILTRNVRSEQMAKLNNSDDAYINMNDEFNPKEDIISPGINFPSNEFFAMDSRINQEKQRISMMAETQRGIQGSPSVSATATAEASRAILSRQGYRTHQIAKLYRRVGNKMLQLAQQYYTESRMVPILGNIENEWSEEHSRDNIQGQYFIDVDVMSMNPIDKTTVQEQAIKILDLTLGMYKDPAVYLKLLSEGRELNLTELFAEILHRMDINNDKVFPRVAPLIRQGAQLSLMNKLGIDMGLGVPGQNPDNQGGNGKPGPKTGAMNARFMQGGRVPEGAISNPGNTPGQVIQRGGGTKYR